MKKEERGRLDDVIGEGPQGAKPQQLRELGNPLGVSPLD